MAEYQTIVYEVESGLCVIKLNRPRKKNSFNPEMYVEVSSALSRAAEDDDVSVTVCVLSLSCEGWSGIHRGSEGKEGERD